MHNATISEKEIEHFSKDSSYWWDENGPFKPLHRLNPIRLSYIRDQICQHFGKDTESLKPLKGLNILDIGCGGGLVCESLARMGATVTGLDADKNAISVAIDHAKNEALDITYIAEGSETHLQQKKTYDVVLGLEIIEHVSNPQAFVDNAAHLCNKKGLCIFSTLNRTVKSYALGIAAAEYILRWVPAGTHDWNKFVKPSEFIRMGQTAGLNKHDVCGLVFNPIKNIFLLHTSDIDVNYLITFKK
jgi:2-polyprenyl-6-hydroxyphenyl methylase/3-demethylubiquinone-9 3-methyltransferase